MGLGSVTARVRDFVREAVPVLRNRMSGDESDLGVHLRGNESLLNALKGVINARIERRDAQDVPADPNQCMASMVRSKELRWLISRLESVFSSPVVGQEKDDSEQPE